MPYEYNCKINRVVDGDTVDVDIDLGFHIILKDQRIRLMGIDAPESRTSDKVEKLFGNLAKERLTDLIGKKGILQTVLDKDGDAETGKFGRILGDFILGEKTVCQILVEEGYAVAYYGQDKHEIELAHLANRNRFMIEGIVDPKIVQEITGGR